LTVYQEGKTLTTSFPITLKSKGFHETRVELQMPEGPNIRIMNQGKAVIRKSDGTVQALGLNNTTGERVRLIPLLSLLAEYQSANVSVAYQGTAKVSGQIASVIALSYIPHADSAQASAFSSLTRTLFYVDQGTGLVDKIQYENYEEGDSQRTHRKMEEYLTQYQIVSGIAVPFRQTSHADGKLEDDLLLKSIIFNTGLADSEFALPQEKLQ
jgi:hypothetical protein